MNRALMGAELMYDHVIESGLGVLANAIEVLVRTLGQDSIHSSLRWRR